MIVQTKALDTLVSHYGITRLPGETDYQLRVRTRDIMKYKGLKPTTQRLLYVLLKLRVISQKFRDYLPVGVNYDSL